MDKKEKFRHINSMRDQHLPETVRIENFEQCFEIPDLKKFIGSENTGRLLRHFAERNQTFKGDIVLNHSRYPFYVMRIMENEVAICIQHRVFYYTKQSNNDIKYERHDNIDEHKGFKCFEQWKFDSNGSIKEIVYVDYASSENNPHEWDYYQLPYDKWSYLAVVEKTKISDDILNKLYCNASDKLKNMPDYYTIKGIGKGHNPGNNEIRIIESYINGNEFPERIYVDSIEVDDKLYLATGKGWYKGKGSKPLRIEEIMKRLKGFSISNYCIKAFQTDYEQGIGRPIVIMKIVEMYENVIAQQQGSPR